jgi:hypothetical protein
MDCREQSERWDEQEGTEIKEGIAKDAKRGSTNGLKEAGMKARTSTIWEVLVTLW